MSKSDAFRRQAEAARRAINSSPRWMRETAVPPKPWSRPTALAAASPERASMSERESPLTERLLQHNPEPIKLVSAAQRDVWTRFPVFRCDHEDGRGRCASTETKCYWNKVERVAYAYCDRHAPDWTKE